MAMLCASLTAQEVPEANAQSSEARRVFVEGSSEPLLDVSKSPRAQAVLEVARLSTEAALAFDRGDETAGRQLARDMVAKLAWLEQQEIQQGNASGRAAFAFQRGRVLLDYLNDRQAAKDALLDALASDESHEPSRDKLLEILDREEIESTQARRGRP